MSECVAVAASLKCFRPGVLIGYAPGSLSVKNHVFLDLCSFAFELRGLVARPPYLSTDRVVSRTTVTGFPEGTAKFGTRCFVGGPAVRKFLGRIV